MLRIHQELKSDRRPNCSTLARELEVSAKTIGRDIDFMRDRMLLPIDYDSSEHGYYYTREVESLPTIDISEGELLALSIAQKAMDHYKGTPFERPLSNALNKLAASLPDTITANLSQLSESISFKQGRLSQVDEAILQTFTKGALERSEINFKYKKLGAQEPEMRSLLPYHLTNYLGRWYVIGWDNARDAMRTFLLSRASEAELTGNHFSIPDWFSAEEYLGSSFGIYSPTGAHQVIVHFLAPTSEYISENVWHPSQTVEYLKNGDVEVRFQLSNLVEIVPWILSWGTSAVAIEPKELRSLLKESASKVAALYD